MGHGHATFWVRIQFSTDLTTLALALLILTALSDNPPGGYTSRAQNVATTTRPDTRQRILFCNLVKVQIYNWKPVQRERAQTNMQPALTDA